MYEVDFLVLGSGISGLYLSHLLSDLGEVLVVTKKDAFESNTNYAQGGIASVLESTDTFESHIRDTLNAGAGLCNPEAVEILVKEGPTHVQRLLQLGVQFVHKPSGELDLRCEGGHSAPRIVHSTDFTGREIEKVLLQAVQQKKNIRILEHHSAVELITQYHLADCADPANQMSSCFGAYVYDRSSWDIFSIRAKATIIATGGAGQVYLHNTNPDVATGDGIALAYRAGAEISNMEFYQFHPTALYQERQDKKQVFLLTEALRGHGAVLRDHSGQTFLERYHKQRELASRDIVARAIDAELKKSGAKHLWLDATHIPESELKQNFPNIFDHLQKININISQEWVPIVPAAHYMCGGIRTNLFGATNITGLYALGEAACNGVHGGNRLASNSLLEGLVFAWRIAEYIKKHTPKEQKQAKIREWKKQNLQNPKEWIMVQHGFDEIKSTMWDYVGIIRSNLRLERALVRIELLQKEIEDYYQQTFIQNKILELRNLALVSHLIVKSALQRKESRGLHYNSDYPETSSPTRNDTILHR